MNERIKELILEAGFPKFDKMYVVSDGEELNKFAELIIKECYESCKGQLLDKEVADTHELTYNDAVGDCAIGLLQHFGLE